MNINAAYLKSIYLRRDSIAILVIVAVLTGFAALSFCRSVRPRYSVAALFDAAEMGSGKIDADPRESLFQGKSSSDIKLDALAFLEFEYLSGKRNANGVTLTEAKDQKSTNLIQVVAEGYTNESIELFLEEALRDLQNRYQPKIDSAIQRGQNQLAFLNKELLSLETFKIQVTTAIQQVGPSPVLGSQLMDINRDLAKLKEDYFSQKAAMSDEKIHNFRLTSVRAMGGGAPVFPKSKLTVLFSIFISLMLSAYAIFLFHLWRAKNSPNVSLQPEQIEQKTETENTKASPEGSIQPQFMSHVSNELRSPLHNVLGMIGILLDTQLSQDQKEYTHSIRTSAEGLLVLINDLLALKPDDKNPSFADPVPFEIGEIIQNVTEHLPHVLTKFKKQITYDISNEIQSMTIFGDRSKIEHALSILATNAIKFSRNNSAYIQVSIKKLIANTVHLQFEVADSGLGIPKQTLERLFDAFEQEDETSMHRFGSCGLGLKVAKRLVKSLNGDIGVESLIGLGSKFWFSIPLNFHYKSNVDLGTSQHPFVVSSPPTKKYRILLAEDNSVHQKIAKAMLEKFGHHADIAGNGNEVLDALRVLPYDLILMDCQMPDLDGYETTRLIRTSKTFTQPDIPIIAVTGYFSEAERGRCINTGMNSFISKPLRAEKLFNLIDEVMQSAPQEEKSA